MTVKEIGFNAKKASRALANSSAEDINRALASIAQKLKENTSYILAENQKDLDKAVANGINEVMTDRLRLTEKRIEAMAAGTLEVLALSSPVGEILSMNKLENGLTVGKMRVPFGVIAIIYESRPNVTVDAAVLTLKAGSAVILRGGKEAINSNIALCRVMQDALNECGLDRNSIQIIESTDRSTAEELMKLNEYVDLLIPRGGAGLIASVVKNATVSVIQTGVGNCHIYADSSCDFEKAVNIIINAKTQRPSVCNAAESLLVARDIAKTFLPVIAKALKEKDVEIRGCEETAEIIDCVPATEEDFYTEFLNYIISVKVVSDIDEAIEHINKYSTGHSEAILTESYANAVKFVNSVDSACVYVNASTRFTDGNEFGLGAEIGISTQKLHARGPMGLREITTTKYVIFGSGQTRK